MTAVMLIAGCASGGETEEIVVVTRPNFSLEVNGGIR